MASSIGRRAVTATMPITGRASSMRWRSCCWSSPFSVGVHDRPVPAGAGNHRQGYGADAAQRADRRADAAAGAGKVGQDRARNIARGAAPTISTARPKAKSQAPRACSTAGRRKGAAPTRARVCSRQLDKREADSAEALARSSSSTSRSPPCAARSQRSKKRSTRRKRATSESRRRSPISAGGSTSALAQRVQELPATARTSSGACARSCRQPLRHPRRRRPFRLPVGSAVPQGSAEINGRARPRSTSSPTRFSELERRSRRRSPGCCASTATPTASRSGTAAVHVELGAVRGARHRGRQVPDRERRSPNHLVAAGFGEFQPIEPATARKPTAATAASS